MKAWKWNGARWWKFDIHTHTPASVDYGKGPEQETLRNHTYKDWLLDFMRADIDCVAITDHNTGQWIDPLKKALEELKTENPTGYRDLILFPGVEISVHGGIHLLAILDPCCTTGNIDALLGAAGFPFGAKKGSSDAVTSKSFEEVVDEIEKAGGIAIPAHADRENGLFEKIKGNTLQPILCGKAIFAMETVDSKAQKPELYREEKTSWTEVLGSDSHHPSGGEGEHFPGSHFTWIKMSSPNCKGLRLALLDGVLSVRRSDTATTTTHPNNYAPLVLESIEIFEALYQGRSEKFIINLNPWLNALIGGRGTGKSTVVEFIRMALRRSDELPEELKEEFQKYENIYYDRADGGLLTDETQITVILRKDDVRFRVQWHASAFEEIAPVEQEDPDGTWQPVESDIRQRFPIRVYSQKQIFQLAKAPLALLRIVDEAQGVDYPSWKEKWDAKEKSFLALQARARELESGLTAKPRLQGELEDVKRKLDIFEESGQADILKIYQKRSRQQQEVERWEQDWMNIGNHLRKALTRIVPDNLDETVFDTDTSEDSELHELAAGVCENLDKLRTGFETLTGQADEIATTWQKTRNESSWQQSVNTAVGHYQELEKKLVQEGAGNSAAYGEWVQRRQDIEQRLKELDNRKESIEQIRNEAKECFQEMMILRKELTEARRKFLNNILSDNKHVSIEMIPYGAKESVESEFRRLIYKEDGTFFKDVGSPDGEGLLGPLYENNADSTQIEQNLADLKTNMKEIALNHSDCGVNIDARLAAHIGNLPPEAMDHLNLWFPEDSLDVLYSATGDGKRFTSIRKGSPGQKTAALLAFLLSYGDEPLILDQPEDDLDNHLIYSLIVAQLREVKLHRQIIVVTHNANIVVNGDAELVVALASRGGETQKDCEGSLQVEDVRKIICDVMEGGYKAFENRYRRIALEGRHV